MTWRADVSCPTCPSRDATAEPLERDGLTVGVVFCCETCGTLSQTVHGAP